MITKDEITMFICSYAHVVLTGCY